MKDEKLALNGVKKGNLFVADLNSASKGELKCFYSKASSDLVGYGIGSSHI